MFLFFIFSIGTLLVNAMSGSCFKISWRVEKWAGGIDKLKQYGP